MAYRILQGGVSIYIHKALPNGLLERTVIVLEYHSGMKCPVIRRLAIPLPCPSGDQRLVAPLAAMRSVSRKAHHHTRSQYGECATHRRCYGVLLLGRGQKEQGAAGEDETRGQEGDHQTLVGSGSKRASERERESETEGLHLWLHLPESDKCIAWTPVGDYLENDRSLVSSGERAIVAALPLPASLCDAEGVLVYDTHTRQVSVVRTLVELSPNAKQYVATLRLECQVRWRQYTYDVMPFDGRMHWFTPKRAGSDSDSRTQFGLCVYGGELGRVAFSGVNMGGCVVKSSGAVSFGDFHGLLSWEEVTAAAVDDETAASANANASCTADATARLLSLIGRFITAADKATVPLTNTQISGAIRFL